MEKKYQKIGVFDSGLGGITVLKELIKKLPNENFIYYADNGNFPYGNGKTREELQNISKNIVDFFIKNDCKVVVVACNTASVAAIDFLRKNYSIPIIGIVQSGAKLASKEEIPENIAVFSTKFTAESNAYKNQVLKLNPRKNIFQIGCPEFPSMIEEGWENFKEADLLLQKYCSQIPEEADVLMLGCTHYPLIKSFIAKYFKKTILDPTSELVDNLNEILSEYKMKNDSRAKGETIFYTSGNSEKFKPIAEKFLEKEIVISTLNNTK